MEMLTVKGQELHRRSGTTARMALRRAAPSRMARSGLHPRMGSGESAVSLNGCSSVTAKQSNRCPTYQKEEVHGCEDRVVHRLVA